MARSQIRHSGPGPSANIIAIDLKKMSNRVGLFLTINGVMTVNVQITGDDVQATGYTPALGDWFNNSMTSGLTASIAGDLDFPVTAIRLNVTAYTSGYAVLSAVQSTG
jgi:hypothetical protein